MNATLAANEKKGGSPVRDPVREWVEDIILGWDLIDIKPVKGKFTWSNKKVGLGHIAARLDRFLVHSSFLSFGLLASSKILPHCTFDHKPILLDLAVEQDLGLIPFRFSPLWTSHKDFLGIVYETWSAPVLGSSFYAWEEKLRRVKRVLKLWAKSTTFSN